MYAFGGGPLFEKIERRRLDEKIENVMLLGCRNDVEEIVFAADIGVLFSNPSHSEGISNSIMEYMALSKPVITTDISSGSVEILEQGKSGFIVQNNLESVVDKLTILLDDESFRHELGKYGREIIVNKFSIERMGEEFKKLYDSV